ncbi:hypothetical protein [Kitasatospora azatica]|uniref:hypothetical protein n=1 Tax=Kitasatospora azatica TaxID=58347 RepID=UPI00056D7982|nr:hypothetical protein [Kitasatospora azatica]
MAQESQLDAIAQGLLQAVYGLMADRQDWPTFTAVDLYADRELGIEDSQAALLAVPARYLFRPWSAHGFSNNDPVPCCEQSAAVDDPWSWQLGIDRPRLRPYRRVVHGVDELL